MENNENRRNTRETDNANRSSGTTRSDKARKSATPQDFKRQNSKNNTHTQQIKSSRIVNKERTSSSRESVNSQAVHNNHTTKKQEQKGFIVDERKPKKNNTVERKYTKSQKPPKPPKSARARKITNIVICASIIFAFIAIGVTLSLTVLFSTENITSVDSKHYTSEQIVDSSYLKIGENIFTVDKNTAEEKIESELPYIAQADIKIRIPNTLHIEVTEATPAYVIENNGEFIVISVDGKVLEKVTKNSLEVPLVKISGEITATDGQIVKFENKNTLNTINEIFKTMDEIKFYGVEEINIENASNITMNYSNRIKIILGAPIDIDYKILTAKEIIEQKLSKSDKGELDVSDCNTDIKASYFNTNLDVFKDNTKEETKPTEQTTEPVTDEYGNVIEQTTEPVTDEYGNVIEQTTEPVTDEYGNVIEQTTEPVTDEYIYETEPVTDEYVY